MTTILMLIQLHATSTNIPMCYTNGQEHWNVAKCNNSLLSEPETHWGFKQTGIRQPSIIIRVMSSLLMFEGGCPAYHPHKRPRKNQLGSII